MQTPVTVIWEGSDSPYEKLKDGTAVWERHTRTVDSHWLDAAHLISSAQQGNVINVRYVGCETEDMEGFRAYCAKLKPSGLTV